MKNLTLILACLALSYSANGQTEPKLKSMEWLLGDWVRTNSKPGRSGFESWRKTNDQEWRGRAASMKGTDTTFIEILSIVTKDGKLYYVADVPQNSKPVYFEITSITKDSFTCENPAHDFPKKIYYQFDGTTIHARVSAGDNGQDYTFERRKK